LDVTDFESFPSFVEELQSSHEQAWI
jgi:hypothetical protein